MKTIPYIFALGLVALLPSPGIAADKPAAPPEKFFRLIDLFDLETASDPQISPDGTKVVFVRNFSDIMKDKKRSNLWIVDFDGNDLRPLTTGNANDFSPRWSPDGKRLLYASSAEGSVQIFVRWLDTGQTAKVTSVQKSPTSMSWSPDGKWIAFAMLVPEETKPFADMPTRPEGADWGSLPRSFESSSIAQMARATSKMDTRMSSSSQSREGRLGNSPRALSTTLDRWLGRPMARRSFCPPTGTTTGSTIR